MYNNDKENLKKVGKICNFDGFAGFVIAQNFNYPFTINDCKYPVNNGDTVSFYENNIKVGSEKIKVAKFISKQKKLDI